MMLCSIFGLLFNLFTLSDSFLVSYTGYLKGRTFAIFFIIKCGIDLLFLSWYFYSIKTIFTFLFLFMDCKNISHIQPVYFELILFLKSKNGKDGSYTIKGLRDSNYIRSMKILMVCLGNICRSPLADGLLNLKEIQSRN